MDVHTAYYSMLLMHARKANKRYESSHHVGYIAYATRLATCYSIIPSF